MIIKQFLSVGITGGIGSGKTTVCQIFEVLGIPVYYADIRAKQLMTESREIVRGIKELFGPEAYLDDGRLNRPFIAGIVFKDASKLQQLNAIVHPAVYLDGQRWHESQQGVPYTLKEAALTFETGGYKLLDKTITVYAPAEIRIQRVMERDQSSREAVEDRISKQMPDEEKIKLADFVVHNYDNRPLIPQVLSIHEALTASSAAL